MRLHKADCSVCTVKNSVKEGKASKKRETFALSGRWADTERICARNAYVCAKTEARFKYKHGKSPAKSTVSNDLLGMNTNRNRTTAYKVLTDKPGFSVNK